MNKQEEQKALKVCLQEIEEKLDWGASSQWHNDVFIELSDLIQSKTGVLLSPTTLKRVWGRVNYESSPSISTLNTLAQFAGYNNWRDFKIKTNVKKPSYFQRKVVPYLSIIVPSAAILTLIFISFFSMTNKPVVLERNFDHVTFSSQPIVESLPNSVVFDFNIGGIQSDNIIIQQFWDKTKTVKLKPEQKQATGIYYFPGYFRSKLIIDDEIIKEHDLFIKSNGWVGTIDYEPVPKYYTSEIVSNKQMSLPKTGIEEISNSGSPLVSSFHLVDDYKDVSGDNILINTNIAYVYNDKWATCQSTKIVILGTEGALIIPFSKLGCVSNNNLLLNDIYINGKENDLSAFGVDLSAPKNISIDIKNKNVIVKIGQQKIYEGKYNESIGRFVGIRYRFLGAGAVNQLQIKDQKSNLFIVEQQF